MENKKYKCPYCGRISENPPSVICPCEVVSRRTPDEDEWQNKQ